MISCIRKTWRYRRHKVSLYQKLWAVEQAKEELKNVKSKGKERMYSGAEFLIRMCHTSLEHLEWQQKEAFKHKLTVENVTRKLIESSLTENKE